MAQRSQWLLATSLSLFFALNASADPLPVSGLKVSELDVFDATMQNFMQLNGISAGVAAIMKDGVPVYRRAFGWQDAAQATPLGPDAVFRLASVTKPLTAALVRNLIADGMLNLNDRVFSLGTPGTGLLNYVPFGTPDPRLQSITVDHLLRHRGGWDRNTAGPGGTYLDLTYLEQQVASDMGLSTPPGRDATTRWIMGKPLQFNPGALDRYSNIGYLLLGLIAESVIGKPLIDQLQQDLFAPLGVTAEKIVAGRTFSEDQDSREPYYDSAGSISSNVFYPDHSAQPFVPSPYGGWDHEARIGQGGVVADPLAILEYLDTYQVSGDAIGGPRPAPGTWRWNHTGSLSGVQTLARQRGDGINYVVFFNKRSSSNSYASQIRSIFDGIFDTGQIAAWPSTDIRDVDSFLSADFNTDGLVNDEDLSFWQLAYADGRSFGDADGDGDSDGQDFLAWQRQVSLSSMATIASQSVPEPTALLLLVGTLCLSASCSRG
ncbi:serine hydrolase domain-containing protein [Bythopirellula goksoeyrii]|uniref:Esterase EstB n=1 Tax=Bythopirellula goksoeyrii TaxID=1400387 RepID=A0A5B9Q2I7_9BACT|nr:serine hydrolase domain-containing protein [Bythopirellula goksoeyrii]QEG33228.1 Esterase EstB [Bythopirellula goksoeyrii]